MKRTKVVCTIGPASESLNTIIDMIEAGMNVARLNLSHGTYEDHITRLNNLRSAARTTGRPVGVILDIQGPKIRTGTVAGGKIALRPGRKILLTTEQIEGTEDAITVNYPWLARDLKPGNTVFIDDGLIELKVDQCSETSVSCTVIVGGELSSRKGVSFPGVAVDLPSVTEADVEHIKFGVGQGVDYIAASFVRKASHVTEIKKIIADAGGDVPVIAKIESEEGVKNIDEIIESSDGIMVARGDLGVETPPEEVPLLQKMIIEKCNRAGKPVITATQMLESMRRNRRPTRAEVTDVAHAIFDGTDAVMLSGETAVGNYPVESVKMMSSIAERIERAIPYEEALQKRRMFSRHSIAEAISYATCTSAHDLDAAAILSSTQSGATARMVSKYRPRCPIVAVTPSDKVYRALSLVWGVVPVLVPKAGNIDQMIDVAVEAARQMGVVKPGDITIITAGVKTDMPGSTNLLQAYRIED